MPGNEGALTAALPVGHSTTSPAADNGASPKRAQNTDGPIEYDEFGLPLRKPRQPAAESEGADGGSEVGEICSKVQQVSLDGASKEPNQEHGDVSARNSEQQLDQEPDVVDKSGAAAPSENHQEMYPNDSSSKPKDTALRDHGHKRSDTRGSYFSESSNRCHAPAASEWSHQQLVPQNEKEDSKSDHEDEWQTMPAYAPYDIYDDDGKLIAREAEESDEEAAAYGALGGAGNGYTRVQVDEDAQSATSMDDNTAYLFKERGTNVIDEDDEARDPLSQMQTTKGLLTEGQRIAYVGLVRLAMVQMVKELESLERTRGAKKELDLAVEAMKMWSQKMMVRLYSHMDIDSAEQIMIEQLAEHGVEPGDLTPALMQNARVKNPVAHDPPSSRASVSSPRPGSVSGDLHSLSASAEEGSETPPLPPYQEHEGDDFPAVRTPSQLPNTKSLDIDLRWTVLCDLFLILISDSVYDARSRQLLERVGAFLDVPWLEICRFEKRVTDALEIQEAANKENWNEQEHMDNRKKMSRNRRLALMGLATVGGGLVIGLSAGLLAPVIGAGLAAGFTTIGVAGTGSFLAGAGGAAIITTTGVLTGGTIAVRASNRRTGAVKTFEYRPLHNNKRVNLVVTVSGWMNGKVDDVRLPYSTVDPIMGDIYSVFWEPEMLQSMGDTINILATEALTQGLQQVLGSTILIALMGALQLPLALSKLSYLIDNPWTVSLARAELAGLILADSLIDRNLGVRPVTLVGFSLGSRVIFSCLRELARKGAYGLVQNVYLFGSPNVAKKDEYLKAKSVVAGRFVNGYATNDWILGYLFRATSGGIMRVAGLAPVDIPGIENINVTDIVSGHMAYRAAMPKLLRECGWIVESDEFTEIEDPDPDNHEKRQRELINEIEEARKQLEAKPEKKRFGLFRSKKVPQKKEWETYDEKTKGLATGKEDDSWESKAEGVLFDVDAIRKEAAELAAQGIEVKQLESTLPPMKLDINSTATSDPRSTLRETKSFNDSIGSATSNYNAFPSGAHPYNHNDYHDGTEEDENITMTFDTPYHPSPVPSYTASSTMTSNVISPKPPHSSWETAPERPPLKYAATMPATNAPPEYNAWIDEFDDDFGKEKEMKMTFE